LAANSQVGHVVVYQADVKCAVKTLASSCCLRSRRPKTTLILPHSATHSYCK